MSMNVVYRTEVRIPFRVRFVDAARTSAIGGGIFAGYLRAGVVRALDDNSAPAPVGGFDDGAPLVAIDAVTLGDPRQLQAALEALGLQHAAVYANDVGGWLPVAQLEAAVARAEVHSLRAALSRTRSGAVTSQGDFAQHSAVLRSKDLLTGAGVTVGVLSNSYDCHATYAKSGVSASDPGGYAPNGFLATAITDVATGDAALMRQSNPAATPTQIYAALRNSALPMGATPGFNFTSGFGFVQADAAMALLPPGAPTISASYTSVAAGTPVTIEWSSFYATNCTASGSWSGVIAASGSQGVTPTTVGTDTYTLTCSNAAGISAAASTVITVTEAPHSGGGGIGLGLLAGLFGLNALRLMRITARDPKTPACRPYRVT
jgi:hypothetical protein